MKSMFVTVLALTAFISQAQEKYFTKTGKISFYSKAPMEDIEAKNKTVAAILDTKSGALQFSVLMKAFEFEKALMQEHFNENYVESDKYPRAEFKGNILNNAAINYAKDGMYPVSIKGKLNIHGVTKDVEQSGHIRISGGNIDAASDFTILLSEYNVTIPAIVKEKISNNIRITVDTKLEPLK
jgi:hypothetical protein